LHQRIEFLILPQAQGSVMNDSLPRDTMPNMSVGCGVQVKCIVSHSEHVITAAAETGTGQLHVAAQGSILAIFIRDKYLSVLTAALGQNEFAVTAFPAQSLGSSIQPCICATSPPAFWLCRPLSQKVTSAEVTMS